MNRPLVSVVVPIYKVEKYINKCIQSIVNQTYKNVEIILVDDGSPDLCPQICDQWAKKDEKIRTVHKPNGGLADARNVGIRACNGEFICFVDSDDWAEPSMVQDLLNACLENNTLMAVCGRYDRFEGTDSWQINKCPLRCEVVDSQSFASRMLTGNNCDSSAWCKIYHKSLWNTVCFPKGRIYEDIAVMYKVVLSVPEVVTVNKALYNYRRRPNSITMSNFSEELFDYPFNTRNILKDVKSNYPELSDSACWAHTKALTYVLGKIASSNSVTYIRYKKEFKSLQAERISLEDVWKKSNLFSKKDRIYCRMFSNYYMPRIIGMVKRVVKETKKFRIKAMHA